MLWLYFLTQHDLPFVFILLCQHSATFIILACVSVCCVHFYIFYCFHAAIKQNKSMMMMMMIISTLHLIKAKITQFVLKLHVAMCTWSVVQTVSCSFKKLFTKSSVRCLLDLLHQRDDVDEKLFSKLRFSVDHESLEQTTSASHEIIERCFWQSDCMTNVHCTYIIQLAFCHQRIQYLVSSFAGRNCSATC